MKRKLLILICCIVLFKTASAQKDSLAFNEQGKYIYYKVVDVKKDTEADLHGRALSFFKTAYPANTLKLTKQDEKNNTLDGGGFFLVSKASSMAKHDDGQIVYKLHVEIKGTKYRYWLTGFVFTPYYRDRYNNYVPQPGIDYPMEEITKKVETRDAGHYLDECVKFSKQLGAKLQQYMATSAIPKVKKDTVTKKVIDTKKW